MMNLSNIVINLKPVGALTANGDNITFSYRPWEVKSIDSIDLMDNSLGSIRYQKRGNDIMRILPRTNDEINGEWVTDKGRYSPLDGVHTQEIREYFIKLDNGQMQDISITTALEEISKCKKNTRIVYGATTDCESIEALSNWCKDNNVSLETIGPKINNDSSKVKYFDPKSDESFIPESKDLSVGLIVGCNPRRQSPLLNVKIRNLYIEGSDFFNIGPSLDLTYPVKHFGLGLDCIKRVKRENYKFEFILMGSDLFRRYDISNIIKHLSYFTDSSIRICTTRANEIFIRFHESTSKFDKNKKYDTQFIINVSENEVDAAGLNISEILNSSKMNIVFTYKGTDWLKNCNIIIPIRNPIENESTYLSRIKGFRKHNIIVNRKDSVKTISELFSQMPNLNQEKINKISEKNTIIDHDNISRRPFTVPMVDYHLEGHPFAEYSSTMAKCSTIFTNSRSNFN